MSATFDVIIIGAGSAGLAALREVRKQTERFLIINDGPYGTTCARVGCMPSKLLIEAANAFHARHKLDAFGFRGADQLRPDLPAVLSRVRRLRDEFVAGTRRVTEELGERSLSGRARLLGPNRVEVNGQVLEARKIIIATGSRPILSDAWRALGERVLSTDTFFDQIDLPRRMGVIGTGALGIELAQALSRLGVEVHLFGRGELLAGLSDERVSAVLRQQLDQELTLHTDADAELSAAENGIAIVAGTTRIVVERVLAAVGRRPNLDDLGLESLGVALDERGFPPFTPGSTQVADLPLFLAGDANGHLPLLHEAADEGYIAGFNALAESPVCFERRTPLAIVFCDPGVATIGQRFDELDLERAVIGEVSFENQGRARAAQRNTGLLRLYADRLTGRLLGAQMCAPAAEHMAHLLALAIDRQLSVQELLRMPFYHPVLEEGLRTALRHLAAQLPQSGGPDLGQCNPYGIEALD